MAGFKGFLLIMGILFPAWGGAAGGPVRILSFDRHLPAVNCLSSTAGFSCPVAIKEIEDLQSNPPMRFFTTGREDFVFLCLRQTASFRCVRFKMTFCDHTVRSACPIGGFAELDSASLPARTVALHPAMKSLDFYPTAEPGELCALQDGRIDCFLPNFEKTAFLRSPKTERLKKVFSGLEILSHASARSLDCVVSADREVRCAVDASDRPGDPPGQSSDAVKIGVKVSGDRLFISGKNSQMCGETAQGLRCWEWFRTANGLKIHQVQLPNSRGFKDVVFDHPLLKRDAYRPGACARSEEGAVRCWSFKLFHRDGVDFYEAPEMDVSWSIQE
nr:hypothetical protein [Pseudobdellovibrionaceae bacterium]